MVLSYQSFNFFYIANNYSIHLENSPQAKIISLKFTLFFSLFRQYVIIQIIQDLLWIL